MALSRVKTWIAGETLSAADLNAEFNNILNNGAGSLTSPRTAAFDMDAYALILDGDADTYFQASTDDLIDVYLSGTLLFKFDGTVSTPVNALSFAASAASSPTTITARGSDTNIGIGVIAKGSGKVGIQGASNWADGGGTVDAITCTISPGPTAWIDGYQFGVRATGANTVTTPTINPTGTSGSAWGAKTIVKNSNDALIVGDIEGDGHELVFRYATDIDKVVLLNPRYPADTFSVQMNALTTETTDIATGDLVPYTDISASNIGKKITVANFLTNSLQYLTTEANGGAPADAIVFLDNSASNVARSLQSDAFLANAITLQTAWTASGANQALYEVFARKTDGTHVRKVALSTIGVGKKSMFIPAHLMVPTTTGGAASGTVELAADQLMVRTLDFDAANIEKAQFFWKPPKSWNESTVTARFVWSHAAAGAFIAIWSIQALAFSNDDAGAGAFGTQVDTADTGGTTNDIYISDESSAVTVGGTAAEGDYIAFQVFRKASDAGDTLDVDARLHGVEIFYTTNLNTDD